MDSVGYPALVLVHIAGGLVGILAGTAAASFKKGTALHKYAGYLFILAMTVMAVPAGWISYLDGKPFDVLSSVFTLYMILTGLLTFRASTGFASVALMSLATLCIAGYLWLELATQVTGHRATDAPVGAGYVFATILVLALWGDVTNRRRVLSKQKLTNQKLLVRHLWRMNTGFFMATFNLFGVRPHLFPEWMQSSGLLTLLALSPLLLMAYWAWRVRIRMKF